MSADLETILIYLQRRYNILREVCSLTEELAEAVERGATWKNDCKYFRKWSIDSYSFIPCSFYLWIVYSPNGEKRLSNSSFPCRD